MKLVVVTTLFGPGLTLHEPAVTEPGVRYVAFTDQGDVESTRWEVKRIEANADPRIQSREIKTRPWLWFPDADVSLWIDSTFLLRISPVPLAEHWLESWDMVALRHPDRDVIEEEANAIVKADKASRERVEDCVETYRAAGFVGQRAITSTGICLRRHSKVVRHFGDLWWTEVRDRCFRDQMSVDYCAWLAGLKIGYFVGHFRKSPYAEYLGL